MAELRQNTWSLNAWYEQDYAGNVEYESTLTEFFTWGRSDKGQLGVNTGGPSVQVSSPVQVPGTTWANLAQGSDAQSWMIATKNDGTLWSWGHNNWGQLGLSENGPSNKSSPVQIPGTTWNSGHLSRGGQGTCFVVKTDSTLWTWGHNNYGGGLGDGTTVPKSSPIQVPGTTWRSVAASSGACFATKVDNTLWSWGVGSHGALGHNNDNNYSSPRQVGIAHDISTSDVYSTTPGHLATAGQVVASIRTDGSLWMWGTGEYGILGQNSQVKRSSPIQVGDSKDWSNVGMTPRSTHAIKTDGTMWVWGSNMDGRLGLNEAEAPGALGRSSPTEIHGGGTNWETVVGRGNSVYATKKDGTLWAWGIGNYGQLGLNSRTQLSSPTQVPGEWARGYAKIAAMNSGFAALRPL